MGNLRLSIRANNLTINVSANIESPKDITKIKKELGKIGSSKNAKYIVDWVTWNGTDVGTPDYFPESATMDEIIKGIKDIVKDMENFEKISHIDLCNFMFSNMNEEDYKQLVYETIDYDDYMYEFSIEEVWDYLDWEDKQALVEDCLDFENYITEVTNNSEVIQCIVNNTDFTIREIIENIQGGDTEDGTN